MLTKPKIAFTFIGFIILTACTQKGPILQEKPQAQHCLKAEQIAITPLVDPDHLTLVGDYVVTCSSHCDTLLSFFRCSDLQYMHGTGRKGSGPHDFTMPWLFNSYDNKLYVRGYGSTNTIGEFSVTEENCNLVRQYTSQSELLCVNFGTVTDAQQLIAYRQDAEISILTYDLAEGTLLNQHKMKLNRDITEDFYQENRGITAAGKEGVVAYAYRFKNRIDFFKQDEKGELKLICAVGDPTNTNAKKDFRNYSELKNYYVNLTATANHFYALCRNGNEKTDELTLEVYNAQGKPVAAYRFDTAPILFCVDEKNGYIYGYRYDLPDTFLRYDYFSRSTT